MTINHQELIQEEERLYFVLKVIKQQLHEKKDIKGRFVNQGLETQKEMWEGASNAPKSLDKIVEFMTFINEMKVQKRKHELSRRIVSRYEKMYSSPYFGRFDFLEKGEMSEEKIYIGIATLIDDYSDILIYDWRSPISSMFYDYETGKANFRCPGCTVVGDMLMKRQYKILQGKIQYMFDSSLKIDDEVLQEILSKSTDSKMKTIVTTIQREQNKVIRNEEYKNLIVQGPAGSGKTSVALHRIAYLLYRYRDKIKSENIIIFSPNQIFNDYISNVLPELGEENMSQMTFKEYADRVLDLSGTKEDFNSQMEYLLLNCIKAENPQYEKRVKNLKYKNSKSFQDDLKSYVKFLQEDCSFFSDIVYRDRLIVSKENLRELFMKDYFNLPLKRRLRKIRERILYLLRPFEEERYKQLEEELWSTGSFLDRLEVKEKSLGILKGEISNTVDQIEKMTDFNLATIYTELFKKDNGCNILRISSFSLKELEEIKEYTLENLGYNYYTYEDQVAMLYLKVALGDVQDTSSIKFIIIDEAQDYTPLQYEILKLLFPHSSFTLLGDLNQSINFYMNVGNYDSISSIFTIEDTVLLNLTKSYRSTKQITEFARAILNRKLEEGIVSRDGEKPLVLLVPGQKELCEQIKVDVSSIKAKGFKSIAVITKTSKESNSIFEVLKLDLEISLISKDDEEYINGIVVIPSYLAKGLEFDAVIVVDGDDESYNREEERSLFYTACTRALHLLYVYFRNTPTRFIKEVSRDLYL